MAQKGRKKVPTELKLLRGTDREDRKTNEPEPDPLDRENPPGWIKGRITRRAWRDFQEFLSRNNVLTEMDEVALEMLAITYGKWRDVAERAVPGLVTFNSGATQISPLCTLEKHYARELLALLVEFGMTPASRSRLDLPEAPARGKGEKAPSRMEELLGDGSRG